MLTRVDYTVEELVAYVKRSERPIIFVEGRDDMQIYRCLEDQMNHGVGVIIPCGGRTRLLDLAKRQNEFAGKKVAFLADSDCFNIFGVRIELPNLIWTHGYSIENDLLASGTIFALMTNAELIRFETLLNLLADWFVGCVCAHLEGADLLISVHSNRVIDFKSLTLNEGYHSELEFERKHQNKANLVRSDSKRFIRGKNIFDILAEILSARKRRSKYSRANLYEISALLDRDSCIPNNTLKILSESIK